MPVISFPTERVFNCATLMRRHITFAVIRNLSNLHLKNEKACNCDNLREYFLLFISHFFFFLFPISSSFYFPFLLLFISHFFFFLFPIFSSFYFPFFSFFISHFFVFLFPISLKKWAKNCTRYACNSISIWWVFNSATFIYRRCAWIIVAELNTPSDGYGVSLDISQIRQFKNGL